MKPNILVLGDIFLDEYQSGECHRISQEAPVPILNISDVKTTLGGAGNTAANVVSLGGSCTLIGRVGAGKDSRGVSDLCTEQQIKFSPVYSVHCLTAVKTRFVGQGQQMLRVDREKILPLSPYEEVVALKLFMYSLPYADVVVISDYAKGFFSVALTSEIINQTRALKKPTIVDPKPCNAHFYERADYITPNRDEYAAMTGGFAASTNVLVTRGPDGMVYFGNDGVHFSRPTMAKEVFDVAGAGDTVVAAFAIAIASKMPIEDAVDFANKAAGVVVGKHGTSTVTREEIEKFN